MSADKNYIIYVVAVGGRQVTFRFHPDPQRLKAVVKDHKRKVWPKDIQVGFVRDPQSLIGTEHLAGLLEIRTADGNLENGKSIIVSAEILPND